MAVKEDRLPVKKALLYIALATFFITGPATLGVLYYFHLNDLHRNDPAYHVIALVQNGPYQGALRTVYLAEMLGLSFDRPTNLYDIDLKKETQKLLSSPLIKSAKLTKVKPGTIIVDYVPRLPIAFLGDFTNTALDEDGYLIPFKPFFSPKKLPEIFLGNLGDDVKWGTPVSGKRGTLALTLFSFLTTFCQKERLTLKTLDVTKTEWPTLGQNQIVAELEDSHSIWVLRLTVDNYEQEMARFIVLYRELMNGGQISDTTELTTKVVDLRVPQLAFITNIRRFI